MKIAVPFWQEYNVRHHRLDVDGSTTHHLIWCQLEPYGEDLGLFPISYDEERSAWLVEEDNDLGMIIDPMWVHAPAGDTGWVITQTWVTWALTEGICPYQPFLVAASYTPYWTPDTINGPSEYDPVTGWDIVYVVPFDRQRVTDEWQIWLEHYEALHDEYLSSMRALLELQQTDIAAMYLKRDRYWAGPYYDEMTPPNGVVAKLMTKHTQVPGTIKMSWGCLAQARDDHGDYRKCLAKVRQWALENLPGMTEQVFDALPTRW